MPLKPLSPRVERAFQHVRAAAEQGYAYAKGRIGNRDRQATPVPVNEDARTTPEGGGASGSTPNPQTEADPNKGVVVTATTLFPGPDSTIPQHGQSAVPIPPAIAIAIQRDVIHFYRWGIVTYTDEFGTPHYTRFCSEYGGSSGLDGETCIVGNEAN